MKPLCDQGWPWIIDIPIAIPQMLGIDMCTNMPSQILYLLSFLSFLYFKL